MQSQVNALQLTAGQPGIYGTTPSGCSSPTNLRNYMYQTALIYQDIFKAFQSNVFKMVGNPVGWNQTANSVSLWNGRRILDIGTGVQANGNGIIVNIPDGYDVLWFRVLGDRTASFRVTPYIANNQNVEVDEIYACGFRGLIETSPDGAGPDGYNYVHQWCPIPIRNTGHGRQYTVYSDINSDDWLSGIAFGNNLWGHAKNSPQAYNWYVNGGSGVGYENTNWNSDQLGHLQNGLINVLMIPIVPNGKNKIVYCVDHNNNWMSLMHGAVTINGKTVERFRGSYMNPFARNVDGKIYAKYYATWFPASYYESTDVFITLTVDMTLAEQPNRFRECGTHDYF